MADSFEHLIGPPPSNRRVSTDRSICDVHTKHASGNIRQRESVRVLFLKIEKCMTLAQHVDTITERCFGART